MILYCEAKGCDASIQPTPHEPDLARHEARKAGWTVAYAGLGLGYAGLGLGYAAWCKSHEQEAHAALERDAA